jgi:branched-chain amino acid aminotransferase
MNECFGKNFILNGELQPAEMFDNLTVYEGESIYEVIRIVKGNPVFFPDHMERLTTSLKLQHKESPVDIRSLKRSIISLSRSDKKKEVNLKIVFNYNNNVCNFLVYFIEPIYPSEDQYKNGVKGVLYFAERKDPESKVINHRLRSSIYYKLIQEGGYEALLVNKHNLITEGSRSNIFFLKNDTLVTAPDNLVLNGITRKHIIEICRDNGIIVELACVNVNDISEYEAIFMTGTTPMVLPFYCINDKLFNVRLPMIAKLRNLYRSKADESIRLFRHDL